MAEPSYRDVSMRLPGEEGEEKTGLKRPGE